MRILAVSTVFALLLTGCRPPTELASDVPDSVVHAAIVASDEHGFTSTPLLPWARGAPLPLITEEGRRTWLFGYTADQVMTHGVALESLTTSPLTLAEACQPSLPTPAYSARLDPEALTVESPPAELTRLSSPSLGVCPPPTAHVVDVRCPADCRADVQRAGCALQIDASRCGVPTFTATLQPSGDLCVPPPPGCEVIELEHGDARLRCAESQCTLDVITSSRATSAFDVQRVPVAEGAEFWPRDADGPVRSLTPVHSRHGHLSNPIIVGSEIIVGWNEAPIPECYDRPARSELRVFDTTSLQLTRTASSPPCIARLARDPGGDGYWTVSGPREAFVASHHRSVDVVSRGSLEDGVVATNWHLLSVFDMRPNPTRGSLVVLGTIWEQGEVMNRMIEIDTRSRRRIQTVTFESTARLVDAVVADDGRVIVGLPDGRSVVVFASGDWPDIDQLPDCSPMIDRDCRAAYDEFSRSPYGLIFDDETVWVGTKGPMVLSALSVPRFDRSSWMIDSTVPLPSSLAPWPPAHLLVAGLVVAGGANGLGAGRATAVSFDRTDRRFLPTATDLGHGMTLGPVEDPRGCLWLSLPWAAELVRLCER